MSRRRLSFTERRRARLALKVAQLDRLETRNTITEPISVLGLSLSAFRSLAQIGLMPPDGGNSAAIGRARAAEQTQQGQSQQGRGVAAPRDFLSFPVSSQANDTAGARGGGAAVRDATSAKPIVNQGQPRRLAEPGLGGTVRFIPIPGSQHALAPRESSRRWSSPSAARRVR